MKIIKIPQDVDPQEIKDKIILLEKQLRQYIRILGLIIATIILEKTRRDLINSDTNEEGTLNIADHEITWNLKYYIYSEKIGGFENQIEPIPITKEMTKGLEKLTRTATVAYNQEVFQKKTILSIYRIPDNFTSHKFLDEVHKLIIAPIWGDIKKEELVKSEINEPEDKNELSKAIEKLDNWRIEDEKLASDYSFNNNQITMNYQKNYSQSVSEKI